MDKIKMFADLGPPDEDQSSQATAGSVVSYGWQLRVLAHKHKTLKFTEFANIDWENKIDFQQFLAYCTEPTSCYLRKWRRKMVPIPCPKHREGTNWMWRQKKLAAKKAEEERYLEWWHKKDQAERRKKAKAEALRERIRSKNPDLWRSDKLWLPLKAGVAIIRGDLLIDAAAFFRDCGFTVEVHNEPTDNRYLQKKGEDIFAHATSPEIRPFTRPFVQVRVSIDSFNRPPVGMNLEDPGQAALRGLNGPHGNAMCGLILFLGSTGDPASDKVDGKCSYWFYSDWGFPRSPDLSKLGEKKPFRMVRLPNVPLPDVHEIMNRFDLKPGKKRAQSFSNHFNQIVRPWRVTPGPWELFNRWGHLRDVYPEYSELDDFGEDDSSEDDSSEDDSSDDDSSEDDSSETACDSSEDDSSEDEDPQQSNAQENPEVGNPQEENDQEDVQDDESEISELTDYGHMFSEEEESQDPPSTGEVRQKKRDPRGEAANDTAKKDESLCGSSIAARTRGACRQRRASYKRRLEDEEPQNKSRKKAKIQGSVPRGRATKERGLEEEEPRGQDEPVHAELLDDIYSAPEQERRVETQAPPGLVSKARKERGNHSVINVSSDEPPEESRDKRSRNKRSRSKRSGNKKSGNESYIPIAGFKSAIPEHLRGGEGKS